MKKIILLFALLAFILTACTNEKIDEKINEQITTENGQSMTTTTNPLPEPQQGPEFTARDFMEKFIADDMPGVYQMWSETTKSLVNEQVFADIRLESIENAGEFIDYILTETEQVSEGDVNGIRFRFTAQQIFAKVTYGVFIDSEGDVAGFGASDVDFTETTLDFKYIIESVTVGAGTPWALDGRLTLPFEASTDNPVPAVVLVHGSGPSDMNGTSYGERVLFDIADYLSANGVAVIRYDKRTFTHGEKMAREFGGSLTVWEETVEDAILAAELLRADSRIGKVYMLGHSLGGSLAPRIHASGGDFDGLILFAGSQN